MTDDEKVQDVNDTLDGLFLKGSFTGMKDGRVLEIERKLDSLNYIPDEITLSRLDEDAYLKAILDGSRNTIIEIPSFQCLSSYSPLYRHQYSYKGKYIKINFG
jgi:hypothetical protein